MKNSPETIRQICAPSVPIFAVFRAKSSDAADAPTSLVLEPCPVVGLVEKSGAARPIVAGLVIERNMEFALPSQDGGFVGYAFSKEDAEKRYGSANKTATGVLFSGGL
ncbi:MAG: hypothetical protein V4773_01780 [Verrucomicrobiota bacterium]